MAYKFGQKIWRADGVYIENYEKDNQYKTDRTRNTYDISYDREFPDTCIRLVNNNKFEVGKYYYLRLKIKKQTYEQKGKFYLKFFNDSTAQDKTKYCQMVANDNIIIVDPLSSGGETTQEFDFTFTPVQSRDCIVLVLERNSSTAPAGETPKKFELEEISLKKINNVKPSDEEVPYFKQIGIQGYPGLRVCVDGELIKVGRTGIYEINNGYITTFLGFIYENNGEDDNMPFILDYQYPEGEGGGA